MPCAVLNERGVEFHGVIAPVAYEVIGGPRDDVCKGLQFEADGPPFTATVRSAVDVSELVQTAS
jgi:hypothetical protein